jgi:hypothetical protein
MTGFYIHRTPGFSRVHLTHGKLFKRTNWQNCEARHGGKNIFSLRYYRNDLGTVGSQHHNFFRRPSGGWDRASSERHRVNSTIRLQRKLRCRCSSTYRYVRLQYVNNNNNTMNMNKIKRVPHGGLKHYVRTKPKVMRSCNRSLIAWFSMPHSKSWWGYRLG